MNKLIETTQKFLLTKSIYNDSESIKEDRGIGLEPLIIEFVEDVPSPEEAYVIDAIKLGCGNYIEFHIPVGTIIPLYELDLQ